MLNPETDLSTSPVRCSHFTLRNPKKSFSTLLFIYFRLFSLSQKKTNSNCCTAALAVYLLLFNSASYYLHSPSTAFGARYRMSACIDTGMLRLVAVACCDMGWISVSVVYCATDQCRKRPEACINAEGGYSEQLLRHCLPDIPVVTHHNRFFSGPATTTHNWLFSEPPTLERTQQTFSQKKTFCNSQVSVVTFSVGVGKWITVCFLLR